MADVFLELQELLEQEMARTGFDPPVNPPCKEPTLPTKLRLEKVADLTDLADSLQTFYNYLSDEITRCLTFEGPTKARMDMMFAEARRNAQNDKSLTNDKMREVEVELNPQYLEAVRDHLYFKQARASHEERRRKVSKSIDRVYRELLSRNPRFPIPSDSPPMFGHHTGRPPAAPRGSNAYKPVMRDTTDEGGVSSELADPPA